MSNTKMTAEAKAPIALVAQDRPEEIIAYACGTCGLVVSSPRRDGDQAKPLAREHCAPRLCACGAEIPETYYTACSSCRAEHEAEREQARFEAAERLDSDAYDGPVWMDGHGYSDGYAESLEQLLELCYDDAQEPPDYVYACTVLTLHFDISDALYCALEAIGIEELEWNHPEELIAFVKGWNEKQTGSWYQADHSRVIVLTEEQKRRARGEEDAC